MFGNILKMLFFHHHPHKTHHYTTGKPPKHHHPHHHNNNKKIRDQREKVKNQNNTNAIGNGATRRCDWRGATRDSWVRGPIVGSPFVGRGFAVRGFAVRGSWVRCSWARGSPFVGSWVRFSWVRRSPVDDLTGGATISTFWVRDLSLSLSLSLFARESFLSLFLSLRVSGNDLKRKFGLKIISVGFGLFYGQTENIFSLTQFTIPTKHAIFRKMISEFRFQSKQTDPKTLKVKTTTIHV